MGNKDILSIITCVNREADYLLMKQSVEMMSFPNDMQLEFIPIYNAASICSGYNQGMSKARGYYKLYLHQDVILQNPNTLMYCLEKFQEDKNIGMIGLAGTLELPSSGIWWDTPKAYIALLAGRDTKARSYGDLHGEGAYAEALDGFFLFTSVDIKWRDDVFTGWHFYDIAQGREFRHHGYKLWLPNQGKGWVSHDSHNDEIDENYDYWRKIYLQTYDKESRKMKISACYIVKNEEKNLARSIESLQDYYDELVVVDTGSTDKTVAIATAYGARLFHFSWENNFAKARNFALSKATGDWIIFLDADEYYQGGKSLRTYIETIAKKNTQYDAVMINLFEQSSEGSPPMQCVRMFRNSQNIRYQGQIHETLTHNNGDLCILKALDLEFIHTGYNPEIMTKKSQRNLDILLSEMKCTDVIPKYYYIAECYFGLQNYTEALFYIKKALASPIRYVGKEVEYYHIYIESLRQLKAPLEEQEKIAKEAIECFPELPEFYGELGMIISAQGKLSEANHALLQCVSKYYNSDRMKQAQGYFSQQTMEIVYNRLLKINQVLDNPIMIEVICNLAKSAGTSHKEEILDELINRYLPQCDELGNTAYYYRHLNKDNKYWLELLKHIAVLERSIALLSGRLPDAQPEEMAECANMNKTAKKQAMNHLHRIRQADTWMLVHLAIMRDMGILPHEQVFFTDDERLLWNVYQQVQTAAYIKDMTDVPLVSILIPTYNMPDIFSRTMRSAAIQDYPNLEIIVCDNSTNDDTATIMAQYAYDKRVRYVRNREAKTKEENFVPFEQLARGEYLQWLMHDDILAPHKILRMAQILLDHPEVSLVASLRQIIDIDGNYRYSNFETKLPIESEWGVMESDEVGFLQLRWCCNFIGEPSSVLFRRAQLRSHYWHADSKGYKVISDVVMWLELLEQGKLAVFKEALSYYRRHEQQEGQQVDTVLLSRLEWFELITYYYKRGHYITTQKDYKEALNFMYQEYRKKAFHHKIHEASPDMWKRYEKTMEKCRLLQLKG